MERCVAYYRVSTKKQGADGLGMAAQRKTVEEYIQRTGAELLESFSEVESGGKNDRPELLKALNLCRLTGARLLIAKLDRLSRDALFLLTLQKEGLPFTALDMEGANEFSVAIMALLAQQERKLISQRTKAALARKREELARQGKRLGNPNGAAAFGDRRGIGANEAKAAKATRNAKRIAEILRPLQGKGASLRDMASTLNNLRVPTSRGYVVDLETGKGGWTAAGVRRVLARAENALEEAV